jgi:hypothetical protein
MTAAQTNMLARARAQAAAEMLAAERRRVMGAKAAAAAAAEAARAAAEAAGAAPALSGAEAVKLAARLRRGMRKAQAAFEEKKLALVYAQENHRGAGDDGAFYKTEADFKRLEAAHAAKMKQQQARLGRALDVVHAAQMQR